MVAERDASGLVLRGVCRSYGAHRALDGVDLSVPAGEVRALLGRNGAGKTTLVGVASGQAEPPSGTVRVAGVDPRGARGANRRLVGVAPQEIGIYPVLTVEENLRFFGEASGLSVTAARARAAELAAQLLLTDLLAKRAGHLSGGQQRRLHAAIALVHRPPVVLLDEPTAGADPQTRSALLSVVRAVAAEGAAVVYTTHYLPEVEELGAAVSVLEAGRIIAEGTIAELVATHAAPALVVTVASADAAARLAAAGVTWPVPPVARDAQLTLPCPAPEALLPDVVAALGPAAAEVLAIEVQRPSLEAVYFALTSPADTATSTADTATWCTDTERGNHDR